MKSKAGVFGILLWRSLPTSFGESCSVDEIKAENPLSRARSLRPPMVASKKYGDIEGAEWWMDHQELLSMAWEEWSMGEICRNLPDLDAFRMVNPSLEKSVQKAWKNPSLENEQALHNHWIDMMETKREDRVVLCRDFFTPEAVRWLRRHLDAISANGIPKRRPNAMNRNGLLLDASIPGGVEGDPELQRFLKVLVNEYLRPIGRAFFPNMVGTPSDDAFFYAFTIQYGDNPDDTKLPRDVELSEHSDASVYTFNININLPDEDFSGSSLYFVDSGGHDQHPLSFESGTAVLHKGLTRHGTLPLKEGRRNNLVIWLHGPDGYVRTVPYEPHEQLSRNERWAAMVPKFCEL